MSEYRSNHFVPKSYLKRWSNPIPWKNKGQKIWMKSIIDKKILEVPLEKQCQKTNLYIIPDEVKFKDKKTIEKYWLSHTDEYFPKSMSNSLDQGKLPETPEDLGGILWFTFYQTIRTPKYWRSNEIKFNELIKHNPKLPKAYIDQNLQLAYLMIKMFIPFMEECIPEFLISSNGKWFITSDNPANYWINTWSRKEHLPTLLGTNFKQRNLEVLFPLNPQICLLLKLNQSKKEKGFLGIQRKCYPDEVDRINNSIMQTSDKVLYSLDRQTLEKF